MSSKRPVYRKKRFFTILLLIVGLAWFRDFLEFKAGDHVLLDSINRNAFGYSLKIDHLNADNRSIRYAEIGNDSLPLLFFIHGAPSSIGFWKDLMRDSSLLSRAQLAAVDRPGYGSSGLGYPVTSLQAQASMIRQVLEKYRKLHRKIILVGSSYGGTLAARMAMDFPDLVDGVVFISASLAPGRETTYDITYWTDHPALNWIIPRSLHSANREKLSHRLELQKMETLWPRIQQNIILLQGKRDGLIFPVNASYAFQHLVNAASVEIRWGNGLGHNYIWKGRQQVKKALFDMLDCVQ